jgi:exodeoxyribonuclease VII large subunit
MAEHRQETIPGAAPADGDSGSGPAPYPVGRYAAALRDFLRKRARVQVIGEVTNLRLTAKAAYFELRDADGAIPCSMWRNDWDRMKLPDGAVRDGTEVVVFGGPDYYPGSATASPSFSFRCMRLRLAGEGDLLARLAELRRKLSAEGLFEPQKRLPRPVLPRTIGIVTGRGSAAEADLLTVLARRGGSLADLWAFCDETLCRTVALLRVPVVSAVGHESDRTLIDDVAAVCCSTPTHAIEEAVRVDVADQHVRLAADAARLCGRGREAGRGRARHLAAVARALGHHTEGQRRYLHQKIREIRASSSRVIARDAGDGARRALVLARKRRAALHAAGTAGDRTVARAAVLERHSRTAAASRSADLRRIAQTLAAHDPDRVLERGYAIVTDAGGEEIVTAAAEARRRERLRVRFSDDDVLTEVIDDD